MGQLYEQQPSPYVGGQGQGKRGLSEGLSLNTSLPVTNTTLPTGPKPEPAPVAPAVEAAPVVPDQPKFDTMSDDELNRLAAVGKGSNDRTAVSNALTAADILEQRSNQKLGLLQDQKTLEEKTKKADIDKDFAEKQKSLTEKQQKILDSEHGHFAPSKETAKDIASIFSIMTFATMGAGTVGKYHGMNALASLTGAMKGYKEGRDDVYKKEMDSYNKSLAEFGKHQEALLKQVELSQKLLSTDKDAAMSAAQAAVAMDTGGMAALKLRQGDYKGTMTILKQRLDAIDKAKKDADALAERKREFESKNNLAQQRITIQLGNLTERKRHNTELEVVKASGGSPRSAINERFANNVIRSTQEGLRAVEQLKNLDSKTGGGYFGTVVGKGDISSSVAAGLASGITTEKEKMYNATISGLSLEIAMAMGGGYKPDSTIQKSIQETHRVNENDTELTAAYKVADVIAKFKASLQVTNPYNETQKKAIAELMQKLDKYDTPENILAKAESGGTAKSSTTSTSKTVNQAEIDQYAKDHFNGDATKAENWLKKQGYSKK